MIAMYMVTLCCHILLFNKPTFKQKQRRVFEHLSRTYEAQQSVAKYVAMIVMILIPSRAGAK
jgi:hypothetical protein